MYNVISFIKLNLYRLRQDRFAHGLNKRKNHSYNKEMATNAGRNLAPVNHKKVQWYEVKRVMQEKIE